MKKMIYFALVLSVSILLSTAATAKDLKIMQYGAWGLSFQKDPFKHKYPVVSYLPPGTILFDVQPSPLSGYKTVLPQYGHKLQIKEKISIPGQPEDISVFSSINGLVNEPPTDSIVFHESVLCLGQSNRIILPPQRCKMIGDDINSKLPVGKGWIYSFEKSSRGPEWVDLNVVLDEKTMTELNARGIDEKETKFDITQNELTDLQKQGVITMLNEPMPPVTFEYQSKNPAFFECGKKIVSEKNLKASMGVEVTTETGVEVPIWTKIISGITAKLGLKTSVAGEGSTGKTWSITTDTTNSSYLYYTVKMTNNTTAEGEVEKEANILIEKKFECKQTPNEPGDRITRVVFEIDRPGAPDVEEYTFEVAEDYIAVPNDLLNHIPRPVFISVNSPEQHADVIRKLVEKQSVDVPLAHFMVSHLNYTCQSNKRDTCYRLISD